jgi:hypothetical protein
MALTVSNYKERQVHAGQNGYHEVSGVAVFSTTDASGELPCRFNRVEDFSYTWIGAPATDEQIYLDEAAQLKSGVVVRPATGTLTVARTGAAKTSDLAFFFRYRGF